MKASWSLAPIALAIAFPIGAADSDEAVFKEKIQPILAANCAACHTGAAAQAGLSVTSLPDLLKGGKRGPAVQPGASKNSLLVQFAKGEQNPRMPVGGKPLPESTINALAAAIDSMQPAKSAAAPSDAYMKWLFAAADRVESAGREEYRMGQESHRRIRACQARGKGTGSCACRR